MLTYKPPLLFGYPQQNRTGDKRGKVVFKRGKAPLLNIFPLPYQGRGIKGEGYHKKCKNQGKITPFCPLGAFPSVGAIISGLDD